MSLPAPDDLPRPVRAPDGGFRNPDRHQDRTWFDLLRWKLFSRRDPSPLSGPPPPASSVPAAPSAPRPVPPAPSRGLAATWVGHSTLLVRSPSHAFLLDPVWSAAIGPAGLPAIRRARPPAVSIESLPDIDAVLLSHDHYDHCDLPTLRRLARLHPRARLLAPLGFARLARRAGFDPARVTLLDWWESFEFASGHVFTATPARHWGNRLSGARNQRLWCGWHLAAPDASLHFAGDTAFDERMFAAIRRRLGPPDLALLPIGAYAPRWFMCEQHCNPAEAVRLFQLLGARRAIGMHWGAFPLTDESLDEPPAVLAQAARAAGLPPDAFLTPAPGATVATPGATTPTS
jgi:L-ascorbate metabolism protein UlaG (beta-lactamase superfamily)